MVFDEDHKNKVGKDIVNQLIFLLEQKKITTDEVSKISDFVLSKIHEVKNHEELIVFLNDLVKKWPAFNNILSLEKGEETEEQTKKQAEELTKNIIQNNLT